MQNIDDVIDYRFVNNEVIEVKKISLSSRKIESIVTEIPYHGNKLIKDMIVENSRLPSIAKVFYHMVYQNQFPTPEQLFIAYFQCYFEKENEQYCHLLQQSQSLSIDGIKARVFRAYPSLLRDFHFYLKCNESQQFESVLYSLDNDTKNGIDISIQYGGIIYYISLMVNTKRSMDFKSKKYQRHLYDLEKEILIPIDPFDRRFYIGDYALYHDQHIDYLIEQIKKKQQI